MRAYLDYLEERGQLARVTDEVDPRFEVAAWIRRTSDVAGPTLLFERVRGSDLRVAGGLFCSPDKALLALETDDHADAVRRFAAAIEAPVAPRIVADGPCQEIVLTGDEIDLTRLPIPTYSEQDGGAFVTVGIGITRDHETGTRNAGIYRMQLLGPRQLALAASPYSDFDAMRKGQEALGLDVEHAVAIGVDPVIHLATQARVGYGVDELGVAGALRGDAVELVRCKTVDLEVPATAEIVIEGRFRPGVRHPEGPFGEFSGYVGPGNPDGEPAPRGERGHDASRRDLPGRAHGRADHRESRAEEPAHGSAAPRGPATDVSGRDRRPLPGRGWRRVPVRRGPASAVRVRGAQCHPVRAREHRPPEGGRRHG